MRYDELVQAATGFPEPYEYQRRMAEEGFPDVLNVPTGTGKTLAAALGWLYRLLYHPDPEVRRSTPRRLVYVLPQRSLVHQTVDAVRAWLHALESEALLEGDAIGVCSLLGGEGRLDESWRLYPERSHVVVGTQDLLLSRALNRGYVSSRRNWPIDFGLLHADTLWVFDEIQLMGPALPTSRQLQAFRAKIGTAAPVQSMWMSATVDERMLATVDNPTVGTVLSLSDADRQGRLRTRLDAGKRVRRLELSDDSALYVDELGQAILERHRPETLTIAVCNTVRRAQDLHARLRKITTEIPTVLLHSRFRPPDRSRHAAEALQDALTSSGRIVVATQVLEAGLDVSSATLFTDAAPWSSIVQRAGRCNRDGLAEDAELLWAQPPKDPAPYEQSDIDLAVTELLALEGVVVTPRTLGDRSVDSSEVLHPMLRRRDLIELFDTAADLSGADLDVGRFIRDGDNRDVSVAWRLPTGKDDPPPSRDELCSVSVDQFRKWLKGEGQRAWRFDQVDGVWRQARPGEIRPGEALLVDPESGGYTVQAGWDPRSRSSVPVRGVDEATAMGLTVEAVGEDRQTFIGNWLELREHLTDVEGAVSELLEACAYPDLTEAVVQAAILAGRYHDIGKAHPVFQDTMARSATADEEHARRAGGPWAKSSRQRYARHKRKHFRHELVSALVLMSAGAPLLDEVTEADLVRYLVAAHHGVVRLSIRSVPGEHNDDGDRIALGVIDGDEIPAVDVPGDRIPAGRINLAPMELGTDLDGRPSWTHRALALRDRPDLGVFKLGTLEAVVRIADWRASAREEVTP